MIGFGDTHKGQIRKINQDCIHIQNGHIGKLDNLYIVADGVGGHNAGEVASNMAIDIFTKYIQNSLESEPLDNLVSAMSYVNGKIFDTANTTKDYENMGTTLLAVTIKMDKLYIAHVGDCRLYGVRNNKIAQMTSDHTYAMDLFKAGILSKEEAKTSKDSRILTRAVGTEDNIKADALFCDVFEDDIFLLCSDGLTDMVDENYILKVCIDDEVSTEEKVDILINKANENGGRDNIAIIIIEKGGRV